MRMALIYKESKSNKNISLKLPTCYQFVGYDTWKVGYQAKPLQMVLLDRNPSAGSPASVRSELRRCKAPCSVPVSIAVVSSTAPPGAALAYGILFLYSLGTLSPPSNITYTVFLLTGTESLGSRKKLSISSG